MGNPLPVAGPSCPRCQSAKTERLDFVALKPQVFQCEQCGHFWFVKIQPPRVATRLSVFSLLRGFPRSRMSGWRRGVSSNRLDRS